MQYDNIIMVFFLLGLTLHVPLSWFDPRNSLIGRGRSLGTFLNIFDGDKHQRLSSWLRVVGYYSYVLWRSTCRRRRRRADDVEAATRLMMIPTRQHVWHYRRQGAPLMCRVWCGCPQGVPFYAMVIIYWARDRCKYICAQRTRARIAWTSSFLLGSRWCWLLLCCPVLSLCPVWASIEPTYTH